MSMRSRMIGMVGETLKENGVSSVNQRDVAIAVAENADIAELWYMRYGKSLPHALGNRRKKLLFTDIQKYLDGKSVRGDGSGVSGEVSRGSQGRGDIVFTI